jgi:hypothetical protein
VIHDTEFNTHLKIINIISILIKVSRWESLIVLIFSVKLSILIRYIIIQ